MTQSRYHSALESACNVLSGLLTANLTWVFVVAPLYGFTNGAHEVLAINLIFTVVSFVRGYLWRRLFNWLATREPKPYEFTESERLVARQVATALGAPYEEVLRGLRDADYRSVHKELVEVGGAGVTVEVEVRP